MIRKLIETRTGPLTDREFREVVTLVTQDIRVNHIGYGQRTSLAYAVQVATITHALNMATKMQLKHRPQKRAILKQCELS